MQASLRNRAFVKRVGEIDTLGNRHGVETGKRDDGRCDIVQARLPADQDTGWGPVRPTDDERNPDRCLEQGLLVALALSAVFEELVAVVGRHDRHSLTARSGLVEDSHQVDSRHLRPLAADGEQGRRGPPGRGFRHSQGTGWSHSEEGSEANQDHPRTTKDADSGEEPGQ